MMPGGDFATLTFTARGPYVLTQFATAQESADVAMQLAAKTLDLQGPRIDGFRPTDPSQFASMKLDPDGLLRRTLPTQERIVNQGLWGPRGYLHFDDEPVATSAALTEAGVDVIAIRGTHVLQARDAASASQLAAKLLTTTTGAEPGAAVPGLPSAKCISAVNDRIKARVSICAAAVDRWAFESYSIQPFDATQKMAAQYLLLTAK